MRLAKVCKLVIICYLIFTSFAVYFLYQNSKSGRSKKNLSNKQKHQRKYHSRKSKEKETIVIWGKAAIGLYLWEHIFEAPLGKIRGELEQYGEMHFDDINLEFRTGVLVTPETVNENIKNAVLIINGREPNKVKFAKNWLDALEGLASLKNLAVILLGNEKCDNEWFMKYMINNGGNVKFAFIVYDIPYIDNNLIFQWPLGVATYRSFPVIEPNNIRINKKRKYVCNFIGTIYRNSSRAELVKIINNNNEIKDNCYTYLRYDWLPNETKETRELYQNALENSDLTLCPVGINTECYRIYEAMSYGSIPIVEDVMTPGQCGVSSAMAYDQTPLRLLKELNAPLIYIKSWHELPDIISRERKLSKDFVLMRRKNILKWYQKFKYVLRNRFLNQLKKGFNL